MMLGTTNICGYLSYTIQLCYDWYILCINCYFGLCDWPSSYHILPHHWTSLILMSFLFFSSSPNAAAHHWPWPPQSWGFVDHTRCTTVGRTPSHEWSAYRRDLYPTTHNTHSRHTSVPLAEFEPTIPAGNPLQTYTLDGAATWIGSLVPMAI